MWFLANCKTLLLTYFVNQICDEHLILTNHISPRRPSTGLHIIHREAIYVITLSDLTTLDNTIDNNHVCMTNLILNVQFIHLL